MSSSLAWGAWQASSTHATGVPVSVVAVGVVTPLSVVSGVASVVPVGSVVSVVVSSSGLLPPRR